jgi:hypothetical protein
LSFAIVVFFFALEAKVSAFRGARVASASLTGAAVEGTRAAGSRPVGRLSAASGDSMRSVVDD